ncbi:ROK family glucokinase [Niallia sp. NCCP-28]|uniref:ROK family glucokinase n=1 Tax=Niallia sp. NCCP-28 TaxID=2934712 RepID=UPI002080A07B|nr:ROK family glucokinase [Niallia sp. NCCP-28]GKU81254.1 glucokinase [Niallia sp. NCCP-28]
MEQKWVIGVDLGGTTVKIAFLTTAGDLIDSWEIPTDNSEEGKNITIDIAKSIEEKLNKWNHSKQEVAGVGMGAPGPFDYETGIIYNTVNLGWPDNFPLKERLEAELGLPVIIDNDANCAALGEMWKGAGAGSKDLVCVTLGTGVGGGVIVNGDIVQGVKGAAGEIGHLTSVVENGAPCNCGKTGCLETIASATGIVRVAKEFLGAAKEAGELQEILNEQGTFTAKDVFDAARNGDKVACDVISYIAQHLGLALANIANTLNPEKIVLGGGVSKAGDVLLKPVEEYFKAYSFKSVAQSTNLDVATLGNVAGVIGAAWLAKA